MNKKTSSQIMHIASKLCLISNNSIANKKDINKLQYRIFDLIDTIDSIFCNELYDADDNRLEQFKTIDFENYENILNLNLKINKSINSGENFLRKKIKRNLRIQNIFKYSIFYEPIQFVALCSLRNIVNLHFDIMAELCSYEYFLTESIRNIIYPLSEYRLIEDATEDTSLYSIIPLPCINCLKYTLISLQPGFEFYTKMFSIKEFITYYGINMSEFKENFFEYILFSLIDPSTYNFIECLQYLDKGIYTKIKNIRKNPLAIPLSHLYENENNNMDIIYMIKKGIVNNNIKMNGTDMTKCEAIHFIANEFETNTNLDIKLNGLNVYILVDRE